MRARNPIHSICLSFLLCLGGVGPARAETWALHGKLYSSAASERAVYVVIEDGFIREMTRTAPPGVPVVETQHWIAPGLIDLHGHLKYNVLGLWDRAKGQFLNRFEWRDRSPPYKEAVSVAMRQIRGESICDAVRWAEIKALSAGVTTVQGVGGDGPCAQEFGARNVEVAGDLGAPKKRSRSLTDIVDPDMVGKVFEGMISPLMEERGIDYLDALELVLNSSGIAEWLRRFEANERTLAEGLTLLTGQSFGASSAPGEDAQAEFESVLPQIRPRIEALLASGVAGLKPVPEAQLTVKVEEHLVKMREWLFGGGGLPGYLTSESGAVLDYLADSAVLSVARVLTRYYVMIDQRIRASLGDSLEAGNTLGVFAHLAEGRRDDAYNRMEFKYAQAFGLVRKGMAFIHGTGFDHRDFEQAAQAGVSIVWSPFSNLLLYGETTDVQAALDAGVNVALGTDWSPTGSKHLLDEMRMARRYLDSIQAEDVTDQNLVKMVTENPARTLHRADVLGTLAPDALADLVLIRKAPRSRSFEADLLAADQEQVDLVVVNGKVRWGDPELVQAALEASAQSSEAEVEEIAPEGECGFTKSYVVDDSTTVQGLKERLEPKLARLDPIFSCEDETYSARVASFITEEIPSNLARRPEIRATENLKDDWSPLGNPISLDALGLHVDE
jgi:cytosine/adenosine deaminase-related metal-dependent hydrolase